MASSADFYFGLLRVSIIQLLKSHGFDRAKPTTVDILTDLYIRYLALLIQEILKSAQAREDWDETVALQDITLALQNLGVTKPMDVLDLYDENPSLPSDRGMQKFKSWCVNDFQPADARRVALPTGDLLRSSSKPAKPLSLIPEYINQLQHERQRDPKGGEDDKLIEELINNGDVDDWIRAVFARQRINYAKRITGKEPHSVESLPSITGLKHSVLNLSHSASISNSQVLPSLVQPAENEDSEVSRKTASLLQRLPAMRPEWRLDNVSLSYDQEPLDGDDQSKDNEDIEPKDIDIDAIEGVPTSLSADGDFDTTNPSGSNFILQDNADTQFAEMEDMDNTFQRRESLDFGSPSQDFDFNGF